MAKVWEVTTESLDGTTSAPPPSNLPPASTPPTNQSPVPAGSVRPKPIPLSCTLDPMGLLPDILTTDTDPLDPPLPLLDTLDIFIPTPNLPPVPKPYLL